MLLINLRGMQGPCMGQPPRFQVDPAHKAALAGVVHRDGLGRAHPLHGEKQLDPAAVRIPQGDHADGVAGLVIQPRCVGVLGDGLGEIPLAFLFE